MRTNVTKTSVDTYAAINATGHVQRREAEILRVMFRNRDYTLSELERLTGIKINCVSGRVNALKARGVLVETEKRPCGITGRMVRPVTLPPLERT